MSKISVKPINESEILVSLTPDVPQKMVNELCNSLVAKGLVEDLYKSTATSRYFYRKHNEVDNLADKLIKNLQKMNGMSNDSVVNNVSSGRTNIPGMAGWSLDPKTGTMQHSTSGMIFTQPHKEGGFQITHGRQPIGHANNMNEAGQMIRQYVKQLRPMETGMHNVGSIAKDEDMDKSGYGPKGKSQYNVADNVKRKSTNIGDVAGQGPNVNVKSYSTKPGQLSATAQAALLEARQRKLNQKQPVQSFKDMSPEKQAQMKAMYEKPIKKSWGDHLPFPNADEEVQKLPPVQTNDDVMATQLANLLMNKSMLGNRPPAQPTDEEMFGHLVSSPEELQKKEEQWGNVMNNWLAEATKPISQRFSSEEEEMAYWASIKIADGDDGQSGF